LTKQGLSIWLEATRPKTLPAAVAPVLLGTALAHRVGEAQVLPALICLGFALLVQIGTNFANDYLDGVRGTDTAARLGPPRAVAGGLVCARRMKWVAIITLAVAFLLGLSLIAFGGWWLLLVGVASVLCAWAYTGGPYPLAYNGLGDVFVVLFFGLIAVGCTFYVQTGFISPEAFWLGLAIGLIINNLLVVNNYRDIDEDRQAEKRTLVVLFGRKWASVQYGVSLLLALVVAFGFGFLGLGFWVFLSALPIAFGFRVNQSLIHAKSAKDFQLCLKRTALVAIGYSVLLSLALVVN